ncbi:MAG: hydrolase [Legionella sp.]|nr:hydrolase [Legionella sp.]
MDNLQKELVYSIKASQETMVAQLHELCEINSGTENLLGLAQISQQLQAVFRPFADSIELKQLAAVPSFNMQGEEIIQRCGDVLFISKRPHLKRRILFCGHMDTVYPFTHPFKTLTYVNDNQINGPGVADMKGGLLVMLHALLAFEQTDAAQLLGWDVLINADEEIGSPASKGILEEIAPHYEAALVYEPAMTATGILAKNRKGAGKFTIIATGKTAHAGRSFEEGRNAICYLAEVITAINGLNGQRTGLTINVGKIAGGEALNMVPDKAVAKLDVRITSADDTLWLQKQFGKIKTKFQRTSYTLDILGGVGRPVKQVCAGSLNLFHRLQHIGKKLGLLIDWKDSGGCCDGNNLAHRGLPVLDTLGVRGGHIHSENEFIILDSLAERASLSALLLLDLAQEGKSHDATSPCTKY